MSSSLYRVPRAVRWFLGLPVLCGLGIVGLTANEDWPGGLAIAARPASTAVGPPTTDQALVLRQRVCVLNTLRSAGDLSAQIVFRSRREGDRLTVSYFVHWSTERPWGDKSLLASLAIDSVYSHFFFVLPGLRYLLHGPGDVEGATVVYRVAGSSLEIVEGFADTESHDPVQLTAADLTDSDGSTLLMTNVWSHQLGAHGAAQAGTTPQLSRRCYEGRELRPLTSDVATRFWLGSAEHPRRARPAWR
jgi:hypothetical protein